MCDTKGHEHWCSVCGKDLNKAPADSYIEIEWRQDDRGQIVEEKSMICKSCLEESKNIQELNKFFKGLEYPPWGHVFCSSCKKDLTKEIGKDIEPGKDYECLSFKYHERSGPGIKHIIRVVVLCSDCVKKEFNAENIEKLKKLGKNPLFKPTVTCPNTDVCKQFRRGDENVNCKHIVIGRDRESLQFGLLCGRRHKGTVLLPFDDGFSISRPRKGKGAAVASLPTVSTFQTSTFLQDYAKEIEKIFKKLKIGQFQDYSARFLSIEARLLQIERMLNIGTTIGLTESVNIGPNIPEDIEKDVEHDVSIKIPPVSERDVSIKIPPVSEREQKK